PDTYLSTWTTVTLPDWTADQNYTMLTIGPENNSNADAGDSTSYGAVDNVCIQLISDTTVTYRGLRHQSIGSAQLAALGDTELVISNMTSTGFNGDGVRVLLPEGVESWYGLANDVDPGGLLPDSAVIHRTSYATVNGFPNSLTGATYAMKLDSNKWEIGIDNSSIGATSYTLEIYNDDTLVHRQPISGAGTTHKLKDGKRWVWIPVVVGIVVVSCTDYHHKTQYDKNGHVTGTETEWSWDCPGIIGSIIPSGGSDTTEGDKIIILSDTYPGIVIQSPSYEEIHFGGIPSVRITEGTHSAEFQGITHTNIGNATLTKWNDSLLTITNVEENDGLLIEVDSSVLWDCDIALDKSPVELPPGATIQTIMRGSYPDDSEGELARMNVVNSGSEFNLSVDFAAIGSPTQSYWIYNGETLVGSGNGVVSPLLQCIDWPDDLHIRFKDWSFKFTWEESTQVVDQAGTKQATMIEISPSIAPTMQHLTEISMIGSGVDSFAITRENGVFVTTLTSTYTAGWQLISVPLEVNDYSKLTLFPTANSNAFRYEGAYYITDTLENGVGYWLKFPTTTSVSMTGIPITVDTIDVDAGWNIIGCISEPVAVSDIVSIPGGIVTSQFYGFDHGYLRQDTIMPNKGNWVKVSTSGKLVLSGSSPSSAMNTIKVVPISELPPSPPDGEVTSVPREFKLEQNYPNPFNPRTVFSLQLPVSCYVTLKVFNILGEEVATVIDGFQVSGFKSQVWEASGVASGVYYYQLKAKKGEHGERFMDVKKMLIIR
ncbi:MAG: T9SS type A sorting domain-containing protein, partial [Bacteroidetes bacterium]